MTPAKTAILLPGTGSDEVFVRSAFCGPVTALGLRMYAPTPRWGRDLVAGYLAELDAAAAQGPILVGGISLGAQVAAAWAVRNRARCAGLLVAMPAWCGAPDAAPAARLATVSAQLVVDHGVEEAIRIACHGVPDWLGAELTRSWRRYGAGLAASLAAAAHEPAPAAEELRGLDVPAGVGCCTDDPVHPVAVAEQWAAALPTAALRKTTLDAVGADAAALGRAAVLAYLCAGGRFGAPPD